MTDRAQHLCKLLDVHSVEAVSDALSTIKEITDLSTEEKLVLAEALSEVFYHAHHTGSTLMPKLAVKTVKQLGRFGPGIFPFVLQELLEADSESAKYFGQVFAKNKVDGLNYLLPVLEKYEDQQHEMINLIQAIGYFKIPEITEAIPIMLKKLEGCEYQLSSMVLYTLGRIVQKHKNIEFSETLKDHMFQSIYNCLNHSRDLVRKNAARALGKMLRKGLLSNGNAKKVFHTFQAITGKDHQHNWDRAYIVRREVEDYLPYFKKNERINQFYEQSFEILSKDELCDHTYHFILHAPYIAQKIQHGQFIILRPHEKSERIPLSICGWNRKEGTLHIIVSAVGKTTIEICRMEPGDKFQDIVGPLGNPTPMPEIQGTCVVIGGGYGAGAIIPTARILRNTGNKVIGILGARTKDTLIMTDELGHECDKLILTTNDGSLGMKGLVTDALRQVIDEEPVSYVLAIGPVPMMRAVSERTREYGIPTYVSLNAIMVDGTGMCGACRVIVGGQSRFACFHGPDFDGHQVDFENLMKRQKMFLKEEKTALEVIENV